jgi:DNA-binding beta-propeller fold protein YncE
MRLASCKPSLVRASVLLLLGTVACRGGAPLDRDGGTDEGDARAPGDASRPIGEAGLETDTGPQGDAGVEGGLVFVGAWGGLGTEPGQFVEPSSVELDSEGFVYVAGHENRFQKFTPDGELVAIYGVAGTGDGQFNHPHGLAVDRRRGDLVYVGDQENHRLQVFTTDGAFVRAWGDAGFQHIHDVGIDPSTGDLFVGDYELHTLRRFSPTGELVATLAHPGRGPGEFDGVWGVSTDSAGNVYVADTFNRRVQKLDPDGRFVAEWSGFEGEPFVKPTGVFVDARDLVHVCDSLADRVLVFDVDGAAIERWDLAAIVGSSSEPEDIVIDTAGTHIYIGEVRGHRVLHLMRPPR